MSLHSFLYILHHTFLQFFEKFNLKLSNIDINTIVGTCVSLSIAFLGIAYPIILDKIAQIGVKYKSEYLSELFEKEFPQRPVSVSFNKRIYKISYFKLVIYLTLFSFLFLIFDFKAPEKLEKYWIVNNSAALITIFFTTLLTIIFFKWLEIVLIYCGKSTVLLKKLIFKYNKLDNEKSSELKSYYLKTINELTLHAINQQDEHLQITLLEFYHRVFSDERKKNGKTKPIEYPFDLYDFTYKLHFELVSVQNRRMLAIEHRVVSCVWLYGEDFNEISISNQTYIWVWRNLSVICEIPKYIKMYWGNASQYFNFSLDRVESIYNETYEIINKDDIEKRNKERIQFLELHYALGGLLLYRNQYKTIKYIFYYTQSQPPQYPLLPIGMTEIFTWFETFGNEFKSTDVSYEFRYPFPELDNLGSKQDIKYWICCYISLLFIRQFTLAHNFVYENHTALPHLPSKVIELENWKRNLSFFKICLNDIIDNTELIKSLDWNELIETKKDSLFDFIEKLSNLIDTKIGAHYLKEPISDKKVKTFADNSNKIISKSFNYFNEILSPIENVSELIELKNHIIGIRTLMSKTAFTDIEIPHLNYDTILAETVSRNNIARQIPLSFHLARNYRYVLNNLNIIDGLNKIIGKNPNAIIIAMNIDFNYATILSSSPYKKIIKHIPTINLQNVIFILNKSDLPLIYHKQLSQSEIDNHQLKCINEEIKLYYSVIDINSEENISLRSSWENYDKASGLKVQVSISFIAEIYWKKNRDIIQIDLATNLRENGIQSDLNEIEPLKIK